MCSVSNTANVSQKWEKTGIKLNVVLLLLLDVVTILKNSYSNRIRNEPP